MNIFATEFNYRDRVSKIRKYMIDQELDCIIVHNWTNQYYLGGHYQHMPWYPVSHTHITEAPLMIFKDHEPVFMAAYLTMNAVREGTWVKDVRVVDQGYAPSAYEGIARVLAEKGLEAGNIGIEEKCCTASTYTNLMKALPNAKIKFSGDILYQTRAVKEAAEIDLIRRAVAIAESAIEVAKQKAQPGVTEMEVQLAMEIEMKRLGAFREVETMCQSGPRTANYRAFAADWKKIQKDEVLTVDLGCLYKGYGCDITRTWVVGTPTAEHKKISRDLCTVYDKFCEYIKPGMTFANVFDHIRGLMVEMDIRPPRPPSPASNSPSTASGSVRSTIIRTRPIAKRSSNRAWCSRSSLPCVTAITRSGLRIISW